VVLAVAVGKQRRWSDAWLHLVAPGDAGYAQIEMPPSPEIIVADERVLLRRTSTFDPIALSARLARHFVRGLLEEAGRQGWVEAATVAVTEVVTNAVLHAHTTLDVTAVVTQNQLLVEVLDHNPALPTRRSYAAEATTGRGMELVTAYTSASGVRPLGTSGKVVWFRIRDDAAGDVELAPTADDVAPQDLDDPPGERSAAEGLVDVQLLGLSPSLWLAAREHHDAILREYALHRAEHDDSVTSADDLVHADAARSVMAGLGQHVLAAVIGGPRSGGGSGVDGTDTPATPGGTPLAEPGAVSMADLPARLDLVLQLRPTVAASFRRLQVVLDAAEALARSERMLIRPALPEIVAVRNWACEQVIVQLGGDPAAAWPGADDDSFIGVVHATPGLDWDDKMVSAAGRGAVAADDANRIVAVSRPLAAALGWEVDDLVGRRVVALVPHRLREAHVAGFSRHLSTGVVRVLERVLQLPMLRKDGTEVVGSVLIQRSAVSSSRSVYVAWIDVPDG